MTTSPDSYSSVSRSRLRTPSRPAPDNQPVWNPQLGSHMAVHRYRPFHEMVEPVTRVLLDASDGEKVWGSIGVSENVIESSWEALVDSLEYAFQ